jgi:signal peptidase II
VTIRRLALLLLVLVATVGCDQLTKSVAASALADRASQSHLAGALRLTYTENPGGFLSLGGSLPPTVPFVAFTIGAGVLLLALLAHAFSRRQLSRLQAVALGAIVGGGLGNWVDRLRYEGRVVDFMVVGLGPLQTGVFNLADVAVTAGAALLVLTYLSSRSA